MSVGYTMRIICFLFFTIVTFGIRTSKSTSDIDEGSDDAIVDTKVVEYDENDETEVEAERPNRKDRMKTIKNFVGTNLFGETSSRKKCFSSEDIALLAARRDFESLIPKDLPNCLLDDELARILMQYFYGANQVIEKMAGGHSKIFAQRAFYDTLGGYLKYYMIPMSRYSFYAGFIKLRTVENVLELYKQCKYSLNTNGNGWRHGITDFTDLEVQMEPLKIIVRNEEEDTSCIQLDMLDEHTAEDNDMIVAMPRLDQEEKGVLGNIWLPFKRKRTFNLQSCMSAFVLLRYFELTTRCYSFQGVCQDTFNKKFKDWILENLEIHFGDDTLYPGLGAILRIVETLRRKNKDTVVIAAKTKPKRQKFNPRENKVRQSEKHSEGWIENVFVPNDPYMMHDYIEDSYTNYKREQEDRMKYIYIAIGISVVFLVIIFIWLALVLYRKWRRKWSKGDKNAPLCENGWFGRRSRKDGDEVSLNAKSSSIASSKGSKVKKSSKSKKDSKKKSKEPETPKCFACCSKKNSPAVIETSSMDSDSGKDSKKKKKAQTPSPKKSASPAKSKSTKTAAVDDKKRFSISRKNKPKDDGNKKSPTKMGILKKNT